MTTYSGFDRPSVDYDFHRKVAAQMRSELIRGGVTKGLAAITPSNRGLRTLGLAVVLGAGTFWLVMLGNPQKTAAADPNMLSTTLTPLDLQAPLELPIVAYDAN